MNIGDRLLQKAKSEFSLDEYERFLSKLTFMPSQSKSDELFFKAPNMLLAKHIQTHYAQRLKELFEEISGTKTKIFITTSNGVKQTALSKQAMPQQAASKSFLNPSLTFETFVVGSSNQFAYTAAKSVAKMPAKQYNPLFIYGGVGLGKTHLLQAIGNYHLKQGTSIIYVTLEQFMNAFTSHLRTQTMDRFREKFRECDLLLIDDVQFLSRKEQTQEEFFHTFNALYENGKQIILTADKPPKKIAGLAERLRSRFEWGLMVDIQPPELETKIAIIKNKCLLNGIDLDDEVVNFIATHMGENIREIEGTIIKLNALGTMLNQSITLEFAKAAIKDQLKEEKERISIDDILQTVSYELNVKPKDIRSKKRTKNVVNARRIAIYLARNLTSASMPQIAQYFGMKDHTAISHTMKKIHQIIESDENFKILLEELTNKIKQKNEAHKL